MIALINSVINVLQINIMTIRLEIAQIALQIQIVVVSLMEYFRFVVASPDILQMPLQMYAIYVHKVLTGILNSKNV